MLRPDVSLSGRKLRRPKGSYPWDEEVETELLAELCRRDFWTYFMLAFGADANPKGKYWIEPEVQGELRIQPDQTRGRDRSRPEPGEKTIRQPRVAVIKFTKFDCLDLYVHFASSVRPLRSTRSTIGCACQSSSTVYA